MKNEIKIFENEEFGKIRTVTVDGEPWFVGKDVAVALGYANPRKAILDHIDTEDKMQGNGVTIRDSIGREQKPTLINESGLYCLILSSKLPSAKQFKRWVTSEVLPTIRKEGQYISAEANIMQVALGELFTKQTALQEQMGEVINNFERIADNITISSRQQQRLNQAVRNRVSDLLNGAHSAEYKDKARSYFINLWNDFKHRFKCSTYKDLNPKHYGDAFGFISEWRFTS